MRLATFAHIAVLAVATSSSVLTGCQKDEVTAAEAKEAVAESSVDSQSAALTGSSVEIGTSFTIGKAAKDAAAELRTFVETQMPCADVTLADATVSVVYGAKAGNCTYRGHTFSGKHTIAISKNEDAQVIVDHTWTDLSNGKVKLTGTAKVTWDIDDKFRQVDHDVTWTRIKDGRTGHGTGARKQTPLAGGLGEGFQVDGSRSWTGERGRFDVSIEGVQWRFEDPVPQAGRYVVATPKGKTITLSFARASEDTIEVTIAGPKRDFTFRVNREGDVGEGG